MKRLTIVSLALMTLVASVIGLSAAESKSYDYTEADHKFRLVVPEGLAVVRGILVVGPYAGGDSRDYHQQAWITGRRDSGQRQETRARNGRASSRYMDHAWAAMRRCSDRATEKGVIQ